MEIEQVVEYIVKYIRDTGESQSAAIDSWWGDYHLTIKQKDLLAREGLQTRVGAALVAGRISGNEEEKIIITRVVSQSERPKESMKYVTTFVQTCYAVADGSEKRLIEFTVKDFDFWIDKNHQQIHGLESNNRVFEMGKKLLKDFNVIKVIELPAGRVAQLAKAWNKSQKGARVK